jgi:hypothetical protein
LVENACRAARRRRLSQQCTGFDSAAKLDGEGMSYLRRGEPMTESQYTATTFELYERLINRLGLALETADVAVRLRDEWADELELRGLSRAEVDVIEAWLTRCANKAGLDVTLAPLSAMTGTALVQRSAQPSRKESVASKVVWLKDREKGRALIKPHHKSGPLFRR